MSNGKKGAKHQPPARVSLPEAVLTSIKAREELRVKAYGEQMLILGTFCVTSGLGPFDPSAWTLDLEHGFMTRVPPTTGGEVVRLPAPTAVPEKKAAGSASG